MRFINNFIYIIKRINIYVIMHKSEVNLDVSTCTIDFALITHSFVFKYHIIKIFTLLNRTKNAHTNKICKKTILSITNICCLKKIINI